MATIADVAQAAGVSLSTVSHALSGKRTISEPTKQRIFQAIHDLNYTANAGAKALATRRSSIMALVVPFTPDEFALATMQYVLVVVETARSLGYDVLMVTQEEGLDGIARVTDSNLVDGVILLDVKRRDDRIAALMKASQPGVLLGVPDSPVALDTVDLDYEAAGHMLVRHLADAGHTEALFLTLPDELFAQDLGYAWRFQEAVVHEASARGMTLRRIAGDSEPEARAATISRALQNRGGATALLVHNDGALAELQSILDDNGLSVPEDIAVVSLYPESFGRMFALPYTAIETSASEIAAEAVRLLARRIEDPAAEIVRHLVHPVIIDRGTSARRK